MFLKNCKVLDLQHLGVNYYILRVENKEAAEVSKPGQFFMLKTKAVSSFLRRPISLHYCDKKNGILEFLFEVKGKGTEEFSKLKKDDFLNIQGPLGNGFNTELENQKIAIIGGGMGTAPLKFLAEQLSLKNDVTLFLGIRSSEYSKIINSFKTIISDKNILVSSDNGTIGFKGNSVELFKETLKNKDFDKVFACGPEKMLEVLHKTTSQNNIFLDISLEERMACGVKACVGCSIKTLQGMKKICFDGPVFNADQILESHPKNNDEIKLCCN